MIKNYLQAIAVFSCTFALLTCSTSNAKPNSRIKTQTEAGFNLEEMAAQRILKTNNFSSEMRTDYYADIYDGQQFLLIPNPDMYKFRLKSEVAKATLQANTKISIDVMSCPEGWSFKVKKKSVGELTLNTMQRKKFEDSVVGLLDLFNTTDSKKVAVEIEIFHKWLLDLKVPLLEKLTAVPKNTSWYFTASHLTKKIKWTLTKDLGFKDIEISITEADDFIGTSFVQRKYEIEFQHDSSMSNEDFGHSICAFMTSQGLRHEELKPEREKIQELTLQRLLKFNAALGL